MNQILKDKQGAISCKKTISDFIALMTVEK